MTATSEIDKSLLEAIEAASPEDESDILLEAVGINVVTKPTRRVAELAIQRLREISRESYRAQVKPVILPTYNRKALERTVRESAVKRASAKAKSHFGLSAAKVAYDSTASASRKAKLALTIFDKWIVNGKPLGQATKKDVIAARLADERSRDGLNANVSFYSEIEAILPKLSDVVSDYISLERINAIREVVFGSNGVQKVA